MVGSIRNNPCRNWINRTIRRGGGGVMSMIRKSRQRSRRSSKGMDDEVTGRGQIRRRRRQGMITKGRHMSEVNANNND